MVVYLKVFRSALFRIRPRVARTSGGPIPIFRAPELLLTDQLYFRIFQRHLEESCIFLSGELIQNSTDIRFTRLAAIRISNTTSDSTNPEP